MDSNRLRYFQVIHETGSIRKAAEMLRLSPAALSKAMKLLQEEAGIALITPSGRGILVTDAGKELARLSKPLLDSFDHLARSLREDRATGADRPIRIGSFEVFTTHFLGAMLEYLPKEPNNSKDAPLLLREVIPGQLEQTLLSREIDYGITYLPIPTAGVEHEAVARTTMGIYGAAEFAGRQRAGGFEDLPFVVPIAPLAGSPNKVQGLDGWRDDQFARTIRYRVTMMESALELCRRRKAVAYLPSFVAALHNETVRPSLKLYEVRPPRGFTPQIQEIYLVRRKVDPENDIYRKLARAMRGICGRR
jgi:DNA-binding transcriptional LysR family regulator